MRRSRAAGTILCVLTFAAVSASAQTFEEAADQVKAAVIFNIAKFSRWESLSAGRLAICTVGESHLLEALAQAVAGKELHGLPVVVMKASDDMKDCQVTVVTREAFAETERIVSLARGRGILTIGEHPRFLAKGGMVNLVVRGQRVRFGVNTTAVRQSMVTLSSKLLQLAEIEDH